jgi:cytochrome c553
MRHWLPALVLVACIQGPGRASPVVPASEAPVEPAPPGSDTQQAMQGHDALAELARAALVTGNVEAFRGIMGQAERGALPGALPDEGAVYVAAARAAAQAENLAAASQALGRVGEACAACHRKVPAARFPATGFVEGDEDVTDRMQLHWWGLEAMWQGLTAPSLRSWEVGAKALSAPDLIGMTGFPDQELAKGQAESFARVARAAQGVDEARRGEAYGKVVGACASCHLSLGKGPSLSEPVDVRADGEPR